jgi:5-(carboxyamino)imidazole ribonucleotide mutase
MEHHVIEAAVVICKYNLSRHFIGKFDICGAGELDAVTPDMGEKRTMVTRQKAKAKPRSAAAEDPNPLVGVIMGSRSDWETMRHASEILAQFQVPHECRVVSAHRTPEWMRHYAQEAEERGLQVLIAGAGGAAHLPGMVAAQTVLPVLGVPVQSRALQGLDSLLSIVQMPGGIPVATLAIGEAGAKNAGLLAVRILAVSQPHLRAELHQFHRRQTQQVLDDSEL